MRNHLYVAPAAGYTGLTGGTGFTGATGYTGATGTLSNLRTFKVKRVSSFPSVHNTTARRAAVNFIE